MQEYLEQQLIVEKVPSTCLPALLHASSRRAEETSKDFPLASSTLGASQAVCAVHERSETALVPGRGACLALDPLVRTSSSRIDGTAAGSWSPQGRA